MCVEGCDNLCDEAEISFQIGYETPCVPPTIFTPNGDGINDRYEIPCIETGRFAENELIIFNQWGDQVYQAKPYDNSWEGTYGGDPLPTGTYYFIFNPGRNSNRLNGFIIIQR
ncbi:MAG: gliding motility-associated C-terminal domain-containing protein [Saprospiraceae bacterium]|nr:gliding motility-associated C-terminal domain-containing protein [Saprospiraceae bacterium]